MQNTATNAIPPGSRILVTGAAGFIGRHLVARLLALDLEVHATSRELKPLAAGTRRGGQPVW